MIILIQRLVNEMKQKTTKLTKRQEQAAETRLKLLQSAKTLFAEKGYSATSVRSINRSVGLADGILYHYFPNGKEELFSVLMQEAVDHIFSELSDLNQTVESATLEEALDKIYITVDGLLSTEKEYFKLLLLESGKLEHQESARFSQVLQIRVNWLADFLERRYLAGEVRKMDFQLAAHQFLAVSVNNLVSKILGIDLFGNLADPIDRKKIVVYTLDQWRLATNGSKDVL